MLWGGVALLVFTLLRPAMWIAPVRAVGEIIGMLLDFSQSPGSTDANFFRRQVMADPGWTFYPIAMLFRSSPLMLTGTLLALVGMLSALCAAIRARRTGGEAASGPRMQWLWVALALAAYALFYLAVISISKKKFDRYALPALLSMNLLAAVGWVAALEWIARQSRTRLVHTAVGGIAPLLVIVQAGALLGPLYPAHYLSYYNPWMGGIRRAVETVPVGWGEGVEPVVEYLAAKPDADKLTVATWAIAGVAPKFPGRVVKLDEQLLPCADYVLLYIGDMQINAPLAARFSEQEPEFVAQVNGFAYAWLYRNEQRALLAEEVAALADAQAAVVTNIPLAL
ncbi:MAG: hypothetical protein GX552_04705, partial [Chloroflexi bacterium]|nr:hypothetical protein [Chloroflexota bacterium]